MESFDLNKFAKEVHENAVNHGWWDKEPTFDEIIDLCHSELSEALEEYRNGNSYLYFGCRGNITICLGDCQNCENSKPFGIAVELADCILRILDYCSKHGIRVDDVSRLKYMAGIYTIKTLIAECHSDLTRAYKDNALIQAAFGNCVGNIITWCKNNDIDIYKILKLKHEYNKTRPYKHGGKII